MVRIAKLANRFCADMDLSVHGVAHLLLSIEKMTSLAEDCLVESARTLMFEKSRTFPKFKAKTSHKLVTHRVSQLSNEDRISLDAELWRNFMTTDFSEPYLELDPDHNGQFDFVDTAE